MPDFKLSFLENLSFDEAITFFKKKVNVSTAHWDDLWKLMHTKGFMIAGAMQKELLEDMRTAVDDAINEGDELEDFRANFDGIVEKYGWEYKGSRNWRTRVIFETNISTAYAAGRYQQMTEPDIIKKRPFWEYRHGDSINPRPQHRAWDGLVLPHDDPWWDTHYPPNGWGCKCRVFAVSDRDMARTGKTEPDESPEIKYWEWVDKKGKIHNVPEGIDPGWDYNVGQGENIMKGVKNNV